MHDIISATKIYDEASGLVHLGYIKLATEDIWVPIDLAGETIAGPTGKDDAIRIVRINYENPIQPQE